MKNAAPGATKAPIAKVLIVDDLEDARWVLTNLIRNAGFKPLVAATGEEALISFQQESPSVVLLDVGLPDMDGFEVLARIKAHDKTAHVIMVTGNGRALDAARAVRVGAWDYVTKPFKNDDVLHTVCSAIDDRALKSKYRQTLETTQPADSLMNTMGGSLAVQSIQREVERVAPTKFSVLVIGESGTGKELVSQAIHARSLRNGIAKPFVAVDCGAIAETLIESELFGHEKGAFTGAHRAKAGAFEMAEGGTIFLDEIGNLPLTMQGKLLRVLETRRVHRIGSTNERVVNFRVVAATNADLLAMVDRHEFRGDLYHRLAEYTIGIAPLRERKEDLFTLVDRFLNQTNRELGKRVQGLSAQAWESIQSYNWPGNARELRNQLRRAVLLCDDPDGLVSHESLGLINAHDNHSTLHMGCQSQLSCPAECALLSCPFLGSSVLLTSDNVLSLTEWTEKMTARMEQEILKQALTQTHGNKAHAARMLRIDYKTIHSKLKAYEISSIPFMHDVYQHEG